MLFVTSEIPRDDSKPCFLNAQHGLASAAKTRHARSDQMDCESPRIVYFFNRSRRPRSSDQRGLGNGVDVQIGGGVRVGDAFLSDGRIGTHSNMGND
jgi:hypothetical protein